MTKSERTRPSIPSWYWKQVRSGQGGRGSTRTIRDLTLLLLLLLLLLLQASMIVVGSMSNTKPWSNQAGHGVSMLPLLLPVLLLYYYYWW